MSVEDTIAFVAPPPRRRRRLVTLLAAVATGVLVTGAALVACSDFEEADIAVAEEVIGAGPAELEPIVLEPQPGGQPEPAQPQPIPIDKAEQSGTSLEGPCPGIIGDGLVITPNPVQLISGSKGAIDIRNCGTEAVEWTASTVAWVTLAETQGSLPSGAIFRLLFAVTTASLPTGPYGFVITVNDVEIPVSGTKLGGFVAPGGPTPSPVPTIGGLIAPGVSPCATKCITRALLSTIPGRADVSLEVRTNTPAKIVAQVDPQQPSYSKDGEPYFADPQIHLATPDHRREWTTVLGPLQPETMYHIVVAAKDTLGGASVQTGTFRTPAVIDQVAAGEPGGCSTACVRSAVLKPRFGSPDLDIEVRTHVPTKLQVRANGETVAGTGGEFVTEWDATLALEPGTKYEITLRVSDEQGRTQQHTAVATTPEPAAAHQKRVLVTFHRIQVHDDADDTFFNRTGELTFRFEVNGERQTQLDTGERKVKASASVGLDTGNRASGRGVIIEDAPDQLSIRVQGQERDIHGAPTGFCSAGDPMFPETSGRATIADCVDLEWNTAEGSIDLHAAEEGGALPACFGFPEGVHGDICLVLPATGDRPAFDVFITIDFAD